MRRWCLSVRGFAYLRHPGENEVSCTLAHHVVTLFKMVGRRHVTWRQYFLVGVKVWTTAILPPSGRELLYVRSNGVRVLNTLKSTPRCRSETNSGYGTLSGFCNMRFGGRSNYIIVKSTACTPDIYPAFCKADNKARGSTDPADVV